MIQAFRFIEISKYDDGGQLMTTANLCLEAVVRTLYEVYYSRGLSIKYTNQLFL